MDLSYCNIKWILLPILALIVKVFLQNNIFLYWVEVKVQVSAGDVTVQLLFLFEYHAIMIWPTSLLNIEIDTYEICGKMNL